MPNNLSINPLSGISGDMFVGALLDSGIDQKLFFNLLKTLDFGVDWSCSVEKVSRNTIAATKFSVFWDAKKHEHEGTHLNKRHSENSRNLKDITKIIEKSGLPENVRKDSVEIFRLLAEAEGMVHGKSIDELHFHELGSIDSVVDICAAALAIYIIDIDNVVCSTVVTGSGTVKTCHGLMPVPAPATAELLKGIPVASGKIKKELTTPTGAALLKYYVNEFETSLSGEILSQGFGAGDAEFDGLANVLSARIYKKDSSKQILDQYLHEEVCVIETNIDDMTSEGISALTQELFELGALDIVVLPAIMKKGRMGYFIQILCKKDCFDSIIEYLLAESTTFGVRWRNEKRIIFKRSFSTVNTEYGEVKVKIAHSLQDKKKIKVIPEYESCVKVAKKNGISFQKMYSIAREKISSHGG
ncbi:MAG: nickel pincer cofactor biosynthesis protein LarC [Verrucomicrobiota bacterium]|nr:nickel pincer cofactor biosynthesis protein LarC [Verrucomicrobiota bacterium]